MAQGVRRGDGPLLGEGGAHHVGVFGVRHRLRAPGRGEGRGGEGGVRVAVWVVEEDGVVLDGEDDHVVVGTVRGAGAVLVQEQAHFQRAGQDGAFRAGGAQAGQCLVLGAARIACAVQAEGRQGGVQAVFRVPAVRVEQGHGAADELDAERGAGQGFDEGGRRGGGAEHHREGVAVAVRAGAGVGEHGGLGEGSGVGGCVPQWSA